MDSRKKRDGAAIEQLGWYNPINEDKNCELKSERIIYWLGEGAQPTKAAKKLLKRMGITFKWHLIQSGLDEASIQKELKKWELDKEVIKKANIKKKADIKISIANEEEEQKKNSEKKEENTKGSNNLNTSKIDKDDSNEEE
tara:strand:- start:29 stop:451 length:423 start_codon:yes stop_codon:yes gene_type:complete